MIYRGISLNLLQLYLNFWAELKARIIFKKNSSQATFEDLSLKVHAWSTVSLILSRACEPKFRFDPPGLNPPLGLDQPLDLSLANRRRLNCQPCFCLGHVSPSSRFDPPGLKPGLYGQACKVPALYRNGAGSYPINFPSASFLPFWACLFWTWSLPMPMIFIQALPPPPAPAPYILTDW